ncbi:XrtA/PEP-CTERM system TPR-repeat protein PrsT [Glaciecola sp. KUL10]|uniref:XrtA/PEP-CTERM system TPR-repeat protein PrsT n=1 Tax=Glaciecola sp. (strain KUL10) TaxID=2161813 RepID=UPI000D8D80FE|nr:XrtA/PEP-CTERM system TPR-repeat protein PrsT [Glaciecola sp. KUL10]GBL05165.1 TPR repeat-containing protein [Glaciecola sp. KUL10]
MNQSLTPSKVNAKLARTVSKTIKKTLLALGVSSALLLSGCQQQTSEDHLEAAKDFVQEGNNQAAIVELKNAIQLEPSSAQARFELGGLYLSLNAYEAAEKELSRALELGYDSSDVIPLLSRAYQKTGANAALIEIDHNDEAMTAVERIEVGFYKLQSLVQLERRDEAESLIAELLLIDTTSVYKGLVGAMNTILSEDYETALAQAVELQKQAPLNKDVLNLTARLYLLNQQTEKAADVYAEYVKAAPEDIETRFALANLLVEQRRTKEAEPHVDKLLEINDQNGLLNQLKGIIRAAENDFAGAQRHSEIAIQNGRTDAIVRLVAGYSAFEQGDFVDTERHLSQIATLLPDNHPGLRLLAAAQLQTGKADEASDVLTRMGNLSAQDATLFSKAGYELLQSGDLNAAEALVERAGNISETADDLTRLGVLKLSLNNVEGLLDLEKAVVKTPQSVTANTTLATAYLATNQLDKAASLAQQWQQNDPLSAGPYMLEGEVELRNGSVDKAAVAFKKAATLEPNNPRAELALIGLDIRAKDFAKAQADLNELLSKHPDFVPALIANFGINKELDKTDSGLRKIADAQSQFPENQDLRLLLARVHANEQQFGQAIDVLAEVEPNADAPLAYWPLNGALLLRSNKLKEAEAHYDNWIKLYPNQRDALLGKLLILDAQNKFEDALNMTKDFLTERDDVQIKIMQAYLFAMTRDANSAKELLNSFEENIQPLPFLRGVFARVALLENRPKDAIADAIIAYEANPSSKNMLLVVQSYDLAGESQNSYDFLGQYIQNNPDDLRALMLKGEKQIDVDIDASIATYEKALSVNENNFIVLNNLAYILLEKGRLTEASTYANRAYELRPDNVAIADTLAQVFIKQSKIDDAVEVYQKVRTSTTENEEIYLNYVEALLLNDDKVMATRRLDDKEFKQPESIKRAAKLRSDYSI